jgi:hypothetical protein
MFSLLLISTGFHWLTQYVWFALLLCGILVCSVLLLLVHFFPPNEAVLARLLLTLLARLTSILEQDNGRNGYRQNDSNTRSHQYGENYQREYAQGYGPGHNLDLEGNSAQSYRPRYGYAYAYTRTRRRQRQAQRSRGRNR